MKSLQFAILGLALVTLVGMASSTTLRNIEEIQPVGDQPIQITGDIDLNNNAIDRLGVFEDCGTNQYLNGNGECTTDQFSPDSTIPDDQQLSISGDTISLDNGGSVTIQDDTIPDDQNIQASASGDTISISIDNGNGASATIADDTIPDDQQLSISGDTISLDNGGSVTIQDDYDPNTNTQLDDTGASSNVNMNGYEITNIGSSGHHFTGDSLRVVDDSNYGYVAGENGNGDRGFYLGWGNGGSTVDLQLDNANQLDVSGGDIDMNGNRLDASGGSLRVPVR